MSYTYGGAAYTTGLTTAATYGTAALDLSAAGLAVRQPVRTESLKEKLPAGEEVDARKIFVGGVSKRDTDQKSFTEFFQKFGEIEDLVLMKAKDGSEGHRGFGFVTFKNVESTDAVLAQSGKLEIDGRKVDVKIALPPSLKPPEGIQPNKIFIGSLPKQNFTSEDLREYFSKWGEITDAWVKPGRGFGFVTYAEPNMAYKALIHGVNHGHTVGDGILIDAKWPLPREYREPKSRGTMHQVRYVPAAPLTAYAPAAAAYGAQPTYVQAGSVTYQPASATIIQPAAAAAVYQPAVATTGYGATTSTAAGGYQAYNQAQSRGGYQEGGYSGTAPSAGTRYNPY